MKKLIKISLEFFVILPILLIFSCKKEASLPAVLTQEVSDITYTTATSGGNVTNDGGASVVSRGLCWNTSPNPTTADMTASGGVGNGPFRKNFTNLSSGTNYYLRAYATNSAGTGYGNEVTFTTIPIEVPVLTTYPIRFLSQTTAVSGGSIRADNGGYISAVGLCWSTTANPTIESSTKTIDNLWIGNFDSRITGLIPGTTYYMRAYATNEAGTGYGNELNFTLHKAGTTVSDIDGNVYNTITIGTQVWMAENLRTTRFNDNTPVHPATNFYYGSSYCWYNNDSVKYKASYGALYNWNAIKYLGGKNLCPVGWHVPTDSDWTTLTTYLGGENVAGGKLKEAGTGHWVAPNADANNESGFSALPGGTSNFNWGFTFIGVIGSWWSSDIGIYNVGSPPIIRSMFAYYNYVLRSITDPNYGFSVRCLRDY